MVKSHHAPLVLGVAAGPIALRQNAGLVVLGDDLVLFRRLVPAPNHLLDIHLGCLAVDEPIQIHIRVQRAARREQEQDGEVVGRDELA